ncbi:MAG: oxidoreductase [Magnetococcales bacterium]|nr:oxidoreductase [Magnetococcales bacterium]
MAKLPEVSLNPTVEAIYKAYENNAGHGFRLHLGASIIGRECERSLWFDFRWTTKSSFNGRMLRLFETGQREEERLVRNLRSIGVTVLDVNPKTGRQWQVSDHGGHFGGSLDGVALGVPEAPKTWHVCEFKTHNIKSFNDLKAKGVQESKSQHYAQMQVYMYLFEMTRALYMAVCKDTDEIYAERVHADLAVGLRLLAKAKRIIDAPKPPSRINDDPAWYQCRMCHHHAICHEGMFSERNCRTCLHITPTTDGQWLCERWTRTIPVNDQRQGCFLHLYIPDLVAGEQVDVDHNGAWVEYRLPDGTIWRDGSGENSSVGGQKT